MSPIRPRRLSAPRSGPGVVVVPRRRRRLRCRRRSRALQEPVAEEGARAERTLPFISQPASSFFSLRQLRKLSQPRGEEGGGGGGGGKRRESKDGGARAVASGLPSSLIRFPALTAAGRDRIPQPRAPAPPRPAPRRFPLARAKAIWLPIGWRGCPSTSPPGFPPPLLRPGFESRPRNARCARLCSGCGSRSPPSPARRRPRRRGGWRC
nr:uncharacterized protein LOC121825173 [Peromyscus maniculatus bairdii]